MRNLFDSACLTRGRASVTHMMASHNAFMEVHRFVWKLPISPRHLRRRRAERTVEKAYGMEYRTVSWDNFDRM